MNNISNMIEPIKKLADNMGITIEEAIVNMGLEDQKDEILEAIKGPKLDNIPSIIYREYVVLRGFVKDNNLYGSLFKIKDLFEIIMKVPTIMALIVVHNNYDNMTFQEQSECTKEYKAILRDMLSDPLAIGSWQTLMRTVKKNTNKFNVGTSLCRIMEITNRCLNSKIGKYDSISNWRNEVIGHGTLMINKEGDYENDLDTLLSVLSKYLNDVNEYYGDVYYKTIKGDRLIGEKNITGSQIVLVNEKKVYVATQYVYLIDSDNYYFDSYYSNKSKAKITNYVSDTPFLEDNNYYSNLYNLYRKMEDSIHKSHGIDKTVFFQEQRMFDVLNMSDKYKKQDYLLKALRNKMDKMSKGIILLQMERGTGKSALSYELNGMYRKKHINRDLNAIIRSYHISNLRFREIGDYYISYLNNYNMTGKDGIKLPDDSVYADFYNNLTKKHDVGQNIAGLLDYYRNWYIEDIIDEECDKEPYILYIIDGIDELSKSKGELIDNLPMVTDLKDNSFILITSRFEDEVELSEVSKNNIRKLKGMIDSDAIIEYRSDDKLYQKSVKAYIVEQAKNNKTIGHKLSSEEIDKIAEATQYKFLYIKPYLALGTLLIKGDKEDLTREIAKNYTNRISGYYYGINKILFEELMASIAVFGQLSIEDFCSVILSEAVTYDVLGCINDLMPLLTVSRNDGSNLYEFANEDYREYVLEEYSEVVKDCIRRLIESFNIWFEEKKEKLNKDERGFVSPETQEGKENREYLGLEVYPKYLILLNTSLKYLYNIDDLNECVEQRFIENLACFLAKGIETIVTEECCDNLKEITAELYLLLFNRKPERVLSSVSILCYYLYHYYYMVDEIGNMDILENKMLSDIVFNSNTIAFMRRTVYGIIENKKSDDKLWAILNEKMEKEMSDNDSVLNDYVEFLINVCDNLKGKEKIINTLLELYLKKIKIAKEYNYIIGNYFSLQKVLKVLKRIEEECNIEKIDYMNYSSIKEEIGSDNINYLMEMVGASLNDYDWEGLSETLDLIGKEIEKVDQDDENLKKRYLILVSRIEEYRKEDPVFCDIIVPHILTLYHFLSKEELAEKILEILDISEERYPIIAGRWYAIFRMLKMISPSDYDRKKRSFSLFGKIQYLETDVWSNDLWSGDFWDNSVEVIKDLLNECKYDEYSKCVTILDEYSEKMNDYTNIKWLAFRYSNYKYDPLSKDEIIKRINVILINRMDIFLSLINDCDVTNNPDLQKNIENVNDVILEMRLVLLKKGYDISSEYIERISVLLKNKESTSNIDEAKAWYLKIGENWVENTYNVSGDEYLSSCLYGHLKGESGSDWIEKEYNKAEKKLVDSICPR